MDYPSGLALTITPNGYGEPESVTGYASGIDYHPNGSIASLTYGNNRVYTTSQNDRQLPWELKVMNGGTTIAKFTHIYDSNANITSIDDGVNASNFDRLMTYDDLDRLKTASGFWGSGTYTYDALGNIKTKVEGSDSMTYNYNTLNRLTSITGANARTFSYDSYGNVTDNNIHDFEYNIAGNMTRTNDLDIDYKYDGHKRRVQEDGTQIIYSVYSLSGVLLHKKAGGVSTDYVYAGSMLVAENTGGTKDYMYTDLLGSPIAGNNGSSYKEHYRPWGEKKDYPIQLADDVGYTGQQHDVETDLTYMQARYYDPVVGRFMSVDPIGFSMRNPGTFNRYSYVNNNPYRYTDPTGMTAEDETNRSNERCDRDPNCRVIKSGRPSYSKTADNYPKGSPQQVFEAIGGKVAINGKIPVKDGGWANSCSIRISVCLNATGAAIPYIKGETSSGANGDWHIFRVSTLRDHLTKVWGEPDVTGLSAGDFVGQKGIMLFDTRGVWDDATGHATLWDGKKTIDGSNYFDISREVVLWKLPD